ncbi:hypothetical protein SY83_12160 [Paenibacillus swuensis]|uniref:DUF3502 domain-containing protein n=1 Tax=Paenibacillus swuensis TaxID=1178515 RepID=A0A172TIM6_9BACL|nr:ABC transporter substrate-binding protein [Paenibacillus swuensis]ANE46905.1 hypothetical protein SY83_12160 [Paenibacillus swuensis]
MNKTRTISLVMLSCLLVVMMVLSACNNNANNKVNEAKPATEEKTEPVVTPTPEPEPEPELAPVKLRLFHPTGKDTDPDRKLVQDEINKYLQDKGLNAELEMNGINWSQWFDKAPLILQSGEQADLMFTGSWLNYFNFAKNGAFLPLDELLEQHGQGIKESLDPRFLQAAAVNGKVYAVPTNKEIAGNGAVFFKKELADKLGIDIAAVKTGEDLDKVLETVKTKEPGVTPLFHTDNSYIGAFVLKNHPNYHAEYESISGAPNFNGISPFRYETKTGKVVYTPELPYEIERYKLLNSWFKKGYINRDAATTKAQSTDLIKAGKAWTRFGSAKPDSEKEAESGDGIPYYKIVLDPPMVTTETATGSMFAIPKKTVDAERAMMVLNLLHTDPKLVNLIVYGIEGKHYEKVSEGVIKPANGKKTFSENGYFPENNWMIGNQQLNYLSEVESANKWEMYADYNKNAGQAQLLGFLFNADSLKNEISALTNASQEFKILGSGAVDPDVVLPKMKKKMMDNGLEKVQAELQKQIDEWKASK